MIKITEALGWLNKFDKSHLNRTNQQLLATARNRQTSNAAMQDLIRGALAQARTAPLDSLDYAETLLNCAAIELDRDLSQPSRDHLAEAEALYRQARDPHGAAVAMWMLGMAELALQNTSACNASWKPALRIVERLLKSNRHIPSTRDWYEQIYIRMNQDLVCLPYESFSWLNQFSPSRLTVFNAGLVRQLDEYLDNGDRNQANRIINNLKNRAKVSPDSLEAAEILAETGLASYRLRDQLPAIDDLKLAVIKYAANSHQQEAVRWLLGSVQFGSPDQRVEAATNWEKSIDGFTRLAKQADQDNNAEAKRWYRNRVAFMKAALKGKTKEYFG